jgi:Arc/MetJ-type ribon-helix-helix transcriptional regulator
MAVTSLNVSLPQDLKEYIEVLIKEQGYSSASEYLRELIRNDQRRRAIDRVWHADRSDARILEKKRREFARRHNLKVR